MAHSYSWLGFFGQMPSDEARQKATEAGTKAVQLDDSLSEAHAALGYLGYVTRSLVFWKLVSHIGLAENL
jgi:hypothetical protein